jgi:predicted RNA methylase
MGYGGNCFLGDPDSEELWTNIIDQIPDEVFLNPDIKILNVACGYGTESMVIVRRMRKLGFEDDYINNRIYVLDKAIWATNRMMLHGRFKNVIRADFLTWETDMKFDIVVGNPPFGKNANLAMKFLNHAKNFSDEIYMILPKTMRKISYVNRIDRHLHLIQDHDNPDSSFGGGIITCWQHWRVESEKRAIHERFTTHRDFKFVDKSEANVFVGRVGNGPCAKVKTENFLHYKADHYFLRVANDEVTEKLKRLYPLLRRAACETVGMPCLSKHDLIKIYIEN